MTSQLAVRAATVLALAFATAASAFAFVRADLKGDYNVEFVVEGTPYTGTMKTTAGSGAGAFTAKMDFTDPSNVVSEAKGKTSGDSVTFDATYEDKARSCTGTVSARGTVEKDGSKASGSISINDSCGGEATGSFRFWR